MSGDLTGLCLYMAQAGFDPPKQIAAQVLKLSQSSTSKPPGLDYMRTSLPLEVFLLYISINCQLILGITTEIDLFLAFRTKLFLGNFKQSAALLHSSSKSPLK